jgi:thermostable 8-oxoguanine DNA glycosylase
MKEMMRGCVMMCLDMEKNHNNSDIVKPLTTLTRKVPWNWKEEEQEAFNELKHRFHNRSILSVIQRKGKLRVEVDASQRAMGGVLT